MRQSFPLFVVCACTALAGAAVLGVPPSDSPRAAERPAKESAAGTDRYGDPLPDGAVARLGTVRFRHDYGSISSLVYAPDGKTLVSGGDDWTVRLWEVKSGRERLRIHDYAGESSAGVAVAPDGKTAASPGSDHLLHLWDMTTGKDVRLLHPPPDAVPKSAAFSPDGKRVVAAIRDESPCLWETATGKLVWQASKRQEDVQVDAACFSPDGKYVAAGSGGGAFLWEASSGKFLRHFGRSDDNSNIAFTPDSACLAASGKDYTVRLWDIASGREVHRYSGHKKYILSIVFTPDGKGLITRAGDETIRFWDVASGRETRRLEGVHGYTDCLALSPDGKTLAAAGDYNTIRFWDVETGKERVPLVGHNGPISDIAFAPDGRRVASGGWDGIIRFWDAADGKLLGRLTRNAPHAIGTLSWSPDGARLASAAEDKTIRIWDVAAGKQLHRLSLDAYASFAFFPDGTSLAVGPLGPDHDFTGVWTPGTGQEPRRLDGRAGPHSGGVHSFDVSPDGKLVAAVYDDVSLCEAQTGKEVRRFIQLGDQEFRKVRFTPDGRTLLIIAGVPFRYSIDLVYVWPLASPRPTRRFRLTGTGQDVHAVELSLDRRVLATGGNDGRICLWDVASGRPFRSFGRHATWVTCLSFAPSGDLLASGSYDTTGLIWDVTGRRKGGRLAGTDLGPDDLERLWKALADEGVKEGWDAVWALAASPKQSLPFLKARLLPRPKADPEQVAALMRDLDADNFDAREKATEGLRKLGEAAEPYLRKRLTEGALTAEVEKRLQDLLHELEASPERRRLDRVYAALERTTDVGAEDLLGRLADDGPAVAWAVREAKESLHRLRKRIAGP